MTQFRVVIQPSASAEIEEAFLWIAEHNSATAVKWFTGLQEAVQGPETFPERCSLPQRTTPFKRRFGRSSTADALADSE